jgi:hypothetical protein
MTKLIVAILKPSSRERYGFFERILVHLCVNYRKESTGQRDDIYVVAGQEIWNGNFSSQTMQLSAVYVTEPQTKFKIRRAVRPGLINSST